jgi:hypothetical protein
MNKCAAYLFIEAGAALAQNAPQREWSDYSLTIFLSLMMETKKNNIIGIYTHQNHHQSLFIITDPVRNFTAGIETHAYYHYF